MNKGVSIVVGATGFIGQSIYKELKQLGYQVIGTSTKGSKEENLEPLDLSDRKSITAFAERFEKVDNLIIAAGREPQSSLMELEEAHLEKMIAIHYAGPLWLIKHLQAKFSSEASILFCSSVAAYKGSYDPTYASLKGAVNSLVRTLARELAPKVRVNAIAPGLVKDSPVYNRMTQDFRERHANASLTKTLLTEKELTDMFITMISQKNLNGQIIHLNGGQYFG
ncbi:MAG: SDR family oxidoreductase [Bacteroidetes bacterium]|nr:SDR family oxidoreductase [Bacteroidota bacterium]